MDYVVYKDGLPVCVGSSYKCANYIGDSLKYFSYRVTMSARGQINGEHGGYTAYRIEEDDPDE